MNIIDKGVKNIMAALTISAMFRVCSNGMER
jgi:hypothetical protein